MLARYLGMPGFDSFFKGLFECDCSSLKFCNLLDSKENLTLENVSSLRTHIRVAALGKFFVLFDRILGRAR